MTGNTPSGVFPLNYRDLFALGVRLFGVWLITLGIENIAVFVDNKLYPLNDKTRKSAAAKVDLCDIPPRARRVLPALDPCDRRLELRAPQSPAPRRQASPRKRITNGMRTSPRSSKHSERFLMSRLSTGIDTTQDPSPASLQKHPIRTHVSTHQ